MPASLQSEIDDLRKRVEALERARPRTKRGSTKQKGAAEYIGRSREYLRQLELSGKGPQRNVDGTYPYDVLDAFLERGAT
jgi:hypothetical protein